MKLSKHTLEVLKNFAIVNPSILLREGNVISTKSIADNVIANATIAETLPVEFGIYELSFFLNTVSLFKEPTFDFSTKGHVVIGDENTKTKSKYYDTEKEMIKFPQENGVKDGDVKLDFNIEKEQLAKMIKAAQVMSLKDVKIFNKDGKYVMTLHDIKNKIENTFSVELGDYDGTNEFVLYFNIDNLRFIAGDYNVLVSIGEINFAHFQNTDVAVNYWIGLESGSVFK